MPGCGFCHQDRWTVTSRARHFTKYHPTYGKVSKKTAEKMQTITKAEGIQWRTAHPEYYRFAEHRAAQNTSTPTVDHDSDTESAPLAHAQSLAPGLDEEQAPLDDATSPVPSASYSTTKGRHSLTPANDIDMDADYTDSSYDSEADDEMDIDAVGQGENLGEDVNDASTAGGRQAKRDAYKKLRHPTYEYFMSTDDEVEETDDEAIDAFIRAFQDIGTDHPTLKPEQTKPFYMCYRCKQMFARRYIVEDHFWRKHKDVLNLFQPSRVPMVLCQSFSRRPIRLLEQWEEQTPHFMGLSVELRGLILRDLLVPSQNPLLSPTRFHYQILDLVELNLEGMDVLKKHNFFVKIVMEYDSHDTIKAFSDCLQAAIPIRLRPILVDKLGAPALTLRLRATDATESGAQLTMWTFPYNERVFTRVVTALAGQASSLASMEATFSPQSTQHPHRSTTKHIIRYLGYLRDMPRGQVSLRGLEAGSLPDGVNLQDVLSSMQRSLTKNDSPEGAMELFDTLIFDGHELRNEGTLSSAFETFSFAKNVRDSLPPFDGDLDPDLTWTYLLRDLTCQICLGACNSLLDSFKKADQDVRLHEIDIGEAKSAATVWGTGALAFCGISDQDRGEAHYFRGRAYWYLSMLEEIRGTKEDPKSAAKSRWLAAMDLFFASLLLKEDDKEAALQDIKDIENYVQLDVISNEGLKAMIRKFECDNGGTWEGDCRLPYTEDELDFVGGDLSLAIV